MWNTTNNSFFVSKMCFDLNNLFFLLLKEPLKATTNLCFRYKMLEKLLLGSFLLQVVCFYKNFCTKKQNLTARFTPLCQQLEPTTNNSYQLFKTCKTAWLSGSRHHYYGGHDWKVVVQPSPMVTKKHPWIRGLMVLTSAGGTKTSSKLSWQDFKHQLELRNWIAAPPSLSRDRRIKMKQRKKFPIIQ